MDSAARRARMAGLSGHVKLPYVWVNDVPRFRGLQGGSMPKFSIVREPGLGEVFGVRRE